MIKHIVKAAKELEFREFSLNFGMVQGTFGKKDSTSTESEKPITKHEILRELFALRNILSNFSIKYEVLNSKHMNQFDHEEDRITEVCGDLFNDVFNVYEKVAHVLFSSYFFVLMEDDDRKRLINSFDYIIFEREMMIADEDYYLEPEEKAGLVTELIRMCQQIDEQIKIFTNKSDNK